MSLPCPSSSSHKKFTPNSPASALWNSVVKAAHKALLGRRIPVCPRDKAPWCASPTLLWARLGPAGPPDGLRARGESGPVPIVPSRASPACSLPTSPPGRRVPAAGGGGGGPRRSPCPTWPGQGCRLLAGGSAASSSARRGPGGRQDASEQRSPTARRRQGDPLEQTPGPRPPAPGRGHLRV